MTRSAIHRGASRCGRNTSRRPQFESLEIRRLLVAGPNLLLNPGFEAGIAAWSAVGSATINSIATPTHAGTLAASVSARSVTADGVSQSIVDRVELNQTYTVSAWVRLAAGSAQPTTLSILQTDDNGSRQVVIDSKPLVSGVWTQLVGAFRGDFNGALKELRLVIAGPSAGVNFFVDDVALAESEDRLSLNLLQNPSFEKGATGWSVIGPATFATPTTEPHTGTRSALVSKRTDFWNAVGQSIKNVAQPGQTYGVSAWMKLDNATTDNVKLTISQNDGAGTQYFSIEAKTGSNGHWVQLTGEFTLVVTGALTSLTLYAEGPVAGVNFYADDFYFGLFDWKAVANRQIDKFGRRDAVVQVVDQLGQPIEGAVVDAQQINHDFAFGTAINHAALSNPKYANFLKQNFEWGVPEYEAKWDQTERTRSVVNYAAADSISAFAAANGIKLRGHNIFWNVDGVQPAWLPALAGADLQAAMQSRLNSVVDHFKGAYLHWDVNNEMLHGQFFDSRLGSSILPWMFQQAHARDPTATLFVNDYNVVAGSETENYLAQIRGLIAAGAPVQAIGAQGHFGAKVPAFSVDQRMANLASAGLPLWITEYDSVNSDENLRADNLERLFRSAFANPSAKGILMWGFWAGSHWRGADGAIVNLDWSLNEAGRRYQSLLQEWTTSAHGQSDATGRLALRGYHGDYRVTITLPGIAPIEKTFSLPPGENTASFIVTIAPPTFVVSNANDAGPGSLRSAIALANGTPIQGDVIDFRIPGAAAQTINILSPLPALNAPTTMSVPRGATIVVGVNSTLTLSGFGLLTKTGAGSLRFTGLPKLAQPSTLEVAAGELQLAADAGGQLSLHVAAGAVARLASASHFAGIAIDNVGMATVAPGGGNLIVAKSLAIGIGGQFDLADNDLIIHGAPGAGGAVFAATNSLLSAGFSGGHWNGTGLASASAAADDKHLSALGVLLNKNNADAAIYSLFAGEPVATDDVLVKFTRYGDANLDGLLDGRDFAQVDNGFNLGLAGWINGDFNYDSSVDGTDFAILDNAVNWQSAPLADGTIKAVAAKKSSDIEPLSPVAPSAWSDQLRRDAFFAESAWLTAGDSSHACDGMPGHLQAELFASTTDHLRLASRRAVILRG